MEALDTLLAAAAIRDENGNPTREAIFAANRILAFSIHHDRRAAARTTGAGPSPKLPRAGGPAEGRGGGSDPPTAPSPSSSSIPQSAGGVRIPQSSAPRIDINLDIRPRTPRPSSPPVSALAKLPHEGSVEAASAAAAERAPVPSPSSTLPPPSPASSNPHSAGMGRKPQSDFPAPSIAHSPLAPHSSDPFDHLDAVMEAEDIAFLFGSADDG